MVVQGDNNRPDPKLTSKGLSPGWNVMFAGSTALSRGVAAAPAFLK